MARIQFDRDIFGNLDKALAHEWLETNGMGGFASSTVAGANTRRYHGLLIAATQPPAVRHLLLSKMEETLVVDGARFELSTNLYPARFIRRAIDISLGSGSILPRFHV